MAKVIVTQQYLEDIADGIRETKGTQDTYAPSDMADAINSIFTTGLEWMGPSAEHVSTFYTKNYTLADTGFNTWTPVNSATVIQDSENVGTFTADLVNYEYFIRWRCEYIGAFNTGATLKTQINKQLASHWQSIHRRPYGLANFESMTDSRAYCNSMSTASTYIIYWNSSGNLTWTTTNSYGIFQTIQATTFNSVNSGTPVVTMLSPTISARCYSSYFSTTRAAEVDKNNSTIKIRGDLYRIKKGYGQIRQAYIDALDMYNNPL